MFLDYWPLMVSAIKIIHGKCSVFPLMASKWDLLKLPFTKSSMFFWKIFLCNQSTSLGVRNNTHNDNSRNHANGNNFHRHPCDHWGNLGAGEFNILSFQSRDTCLDNCYSLPSLCTAFLDNKAVAFASSEAFFCVSMMYCVLWSIAMLEVAMKKMLGSFLYLLSVKIKVKWLKNYQ